MVMEFTLFGLFLFIDVLKCIYTLDFYVFRLFVYLFATNGPRPSSPYTPLQPFPMFQNEDFLFNTSKWTLLRRHQLL